MQHAPLPVFDKGGLRRGRDLEQGLSRPAGDRALAALHRQAAGPAPRSSPSRPDPAPRGPTFSGGCGGSAMTVCCAGRSGLNAFVRFQAGLHRSPRRNGKTDCGSEGCAILRQLASVVQRYGFGMAKVWVLPERCAECFSGGRRPIRFTNRASYGLPADVAHERHGASG